MADAVLNIISWIAVLSVVAIIAAIAIILVGIAWGVLREALP